MSIEEKVKIIQDCLHENTRIKKVAWRSGVTASTVTQWMYNYETDGPGAFWPYKHRIYSPDLKRQAVQDYLSGGMGLQKILKKYGLVGKSNAATGFKCILLMRILIPSRFKE